MLKEVWLGLAIEIALASTKSLLHRVTLKKKEDVIFPSAFLLLFIFWFVKKIIKNGYHGGGSAMVTELLTGLP